MGDDAVRLLIRRLDAWLRRRKGIRPLRHDPHCLFRFNITRLERPLATASGVIATGEPVIELHYWSEHVPSLPASGATFGWGAGARRRLRTSLEELARRAREDPELATARAVVAVAGFFSTREAAAWRRLIARIGFESAPYRSRLGAFGDFWQKVYLWLLLWTYNRAALRGRRLSQLERVLVWMPADELMRRYAVDRATAAHQQDAGAMHDMAASPH